MPGKNFHLRTTPQETAVVADDAVGDLVRRLSDQLLKAPGDPPTDDPAQALALLHLLDHVRRAAERLQREAAVAAARAGAGYPQLGAACGMTRQGARRRWPGLFHHSDEQPTEHPMMTTPARPFDVLLVEDDVADAMLIEEALAERGARNLVQVTDGVAALEHLRGDGNARPDLIVLDLNMPRMNGRELLKILKSDEDLQTIPVVVLTTSTAPDDVTGAYSSHANAYVTKPVNLEEFEQAVQSIDAFYLDTVTRPRP
ncbi:MULTISPECIES: response regulator [Streptomyces]|uniref:Response regulator n=1 Tax=Streptomyces antibioticus TaxID=1890 RepID=A0AAE6YEJ7_STRAT|nr:MULTISPECIES: response regulator [Streptomyces]QIT47384.1 response regulator [Streptomyces antibioticus]SMF40008.1 Response regulators consisting of a CheY-like receiver domain and a winged-helix DNA-binding domain [Streptomyces sp. Amel2xC10]